MSPLVHNDHHAAPDPNLSIPVQGELLDVAIETALGALFVHDLAIVISFSSTWSLFDAGPSH